MNSPYMGKFRVSQEYKGAAHDGLDLVGVDSKNIHSTVNGTVRFVGFEANGFGNYLKIQKDGTDEWYIYGHCSKIIVKTGDNVKITDIIAIEGSTGNSTGSHCHYCCRIDGVKGKFKDIAALSGIPNKIGTYDDGYREPVSPPPPTTPSEQKFAIGESVIISGQLYGTSAGANPGAIVTNRATKITRYSKGSPYPYNTTGDLGWIAESSIKAADTAPFAKQILLNPGTWNVRKTPSMSGEILKTVNGGSTLDYYAKENGWYKLDNGYIGPEAVKEEI